MTPERAELLVSVSQVLIFLGLLLGGLGGLGQYYFSKTLETAREAAVFRYFEGSLAYDPGKVQADDRPFLNALDRAKRRADEEWIVALKATADTSRLHVVNDYVFKVFRHLHFVESAWLKAHGRYFQGKLTMPTAPDYRANAPVALGVGLTDQVDDWRDVGYVDQYAPVALRTDVYEGPGGHGYVVTAQVRVNADLWQNQMHEGPEPREVRQFRWVKTTTPQ